MPKKTTKKPPKKPQKKQAPKIKKSAKKSRLDPGKKLCKSCGNMIAIHKKVCGECGHVHQMRKKKQDVLKNLNKITPIIIKSVIENNDFNHFRGWNEKVGFKIGGLQGEGMLKRTSSEQSGENVPKTMGRRRSQQSKSENITPLISFKQLNHDDFYCLTLNNPISSICSSQHWLIFSETISKTPLGLTQKQLLTIEAYQLQRFHLVEVDYIGTSHLYYAYNDKNMSNVQEFKFNKILIPHCVLSMKVFCNLVTVLTGKASLLLFSLPVPNSTNNTFTLSSPLELSEPAHDKITCYQYLRSTVSKEKDPNILLAVGTLQGHISIYKISNDGYKLIRYIPNAHRQMVTVISQCSLNKNYENKEQQEQQDQQEQSIETGILFASGCFDGTVSIWDMVQKSPIFTCQCSNRKIWSIYWDPGAKFLFINRQQLNDTCIILCFYSINKIQTSIHLSNTIETRSIKTYLNSTMCHNDYYSKFLPILDSVNGVFKIFQIEELRGNSLKKKKSKKQDSSEIYYQILFKKGIQNGQTRGNTKNQLKNYVEIEQFSIDSQDEQKKRKIMKAQPEQVKKFPIFSGLSIQNKQNCDIVYFASYNGNLIAYIHDLKQSD